MAGIIQFNKYEQEECCSTCSIIQEYVSHVQQADNEDALFEILSDLVNEVQLIETKEQLLQEIHQRIEILKQLDCGCDGDCDCED